MHSLKKLSALAVAILCIIPLVACGKVNTEPGVWYLGEYVDENLKSKDNVKFLFDDVQNTLDPASVYSKIQFNERLLYGNYAIDDLEKGLEAFKSDVTFSDVQFDDATVNVSNIPVRICNGSKYIAHSDICYQLRDFEQADKEHVAILSFVSGDDFVNCAFSFVVNGNKITYTELTQTSENDEKLVYKTGKAVFEYEFEITGPHLTLKTDDDAIVFTAYNFSANNTRGLEFSSYSAPDTPLIGDIDCICATNGSFNYAQKRIKEGESMSEFYRYAAYKFEDNGRVTFYLCDNNSGEETIIVKQFAYIIQSQDGVFDDFQAYFFDGTKKYDYSYSYMDREYGYLEIAGIDTEGLTEEDVKSIDEKKTDLFNDLSKEFAAKGINVKINRLTGEIAMDASVLFGGDSAIITDEGKALIDKFLEVYVSVAFDEKYDGFIAKTVVEGHTAPTANSTYESGLPLSEERANNVKDYCIEYCNTHASEKKNAKLASAIEAVGYSNSRPVYDSDGEIDKAACRRVSFRFVVNVENAIK